MEACPFAKAGWDSRAPGAQTGVSGEAKVCGGLCRGRGAGSSLPRGPLMGLEGEWRLVGLLLLGAWPRSATCPVARASWMREGGQQPAKTLQGLERKCQGGCLGLLDWLLPPPGHQALPSGSIESRGGTWKEISAQGSGGVGKASWQEGALTPGCVPHEDPGRLFSGRPPAQVRRRASRWGSWAQI